MKLGRIQIIGAVALGFAAAALIGWAVLRAVDSRPGTALDQGWSVADVKRWYGAYQGSRLMPLAWFDALEQPGGHAPFKADQYLARFGYLTQPGQLPVGFAIDSQDATGLAHTNLVWKQGQGPSEPWVGMTCSACHTNEIRY
ncbi:MAG TPA: hypothetical protein VHY34_07800, partial [Caulobacteraceae bacterium]|nr:hypothetical protein [Caulobacteraceae bacterium]